MKWFLRIGWGVTVVFGVIITFAIPIVKELSVALHEIQQQIALHQTRIAELEHKASKIIEYKDKNEAQVVEMLRKIDSVDRKGNGP